MVNNVGLPAIDPPVDRSYTIPVSNIGMVGFLTTLFLLDGGITCFDWETVDTGPPLDGVSNGELRQLFTTLE